MHVNLVTLNVYFTISNCFSIWLLICPSFGVQFFVKSFKPRAESSSLSFKKNQDNTVWEVVKTNDVLFLARLTADKKRVKLLKRLKSKRTWTKPGVDLWDFATFEKVMGECPWQNGFWLGMVFAVFSWRSWDIDSHLRCRSPSHTVRAYLRKWRIHSVLNNGAEERCS